MFTKLAVGIGIVGVLFVYGYGFVFTTSNISSDGPIGAVFMTAAVILFIYTIFSAYQTVQK